MKIFSKKNERVFLDYASATPVRKEVREAMQDYYVKHFANPSALYSEAREAKEIMQTARAEVSSFLNAAKERITFTSGGTEANNIAILGTFEAAKKTVAKPHIISVMTEHPSVRDVLSEIEKRGGEVTLLQPNIDGLITVEQVMQAIKENTVLISIMLVNNEIGVLQPVKDIAQALKKLKKRPYLHTDACQAPLFQTLDVSTLGVDLLTLDGLKVYGPSGIGCLYVKHDVIISPVMFGGGQESGLRSGTENVAHMVGFAQALTLAKSERAEFAESVEKLRDYFLDNILEKFPDAALNGSRKHRAPNNINVCFKGIDAEYLVVALDTYGVACSYSSSCRTLKEDSSSYVVEALGKGECALSSIRFTLGKETTKEDADNALEALEKALVQVRK